jgi:hypothetical protein
MTIFGYTMVTEIALVQIGGVDQASFIARTREQL